MKCEKCGKNVSKKCCCLLPAGETFRQCCGYYCTSCGDNRNHLPRLKSTK